MVIHLWVWFTVCLSHWAVSILPTTEFSGLSKFAPQFPGANTPSTQAPLTSREPHPPSTRPRPIHSQPRPLTARPRPQIAKGKKAGAGGPGPLSCRPCPGPGPLCHLPTVDGPGSGPVVWEELEVQYGRESLSPLETQYRPVLGDSQWFPRGRARQIAGPEGGRLPVDGSRGCGVRKGKRRRRRWQGFLSTRSAFQRPAQLKGLDLERSFWPGWEVGGA